MTLHHHAAAASAASSAEDLQRRARGRRGAVLVGGEEHYLLLGDGRVDSRRTVCRLLRGRCSSWGRIKLTMDAPCFTRARCCCLGRAGGEAGGAAHVCQLSVTAAPSSRHRRCKVPRPGPKEAATCSFEAGMRLNLAVAPVPAVKVSRAPLCVCAACTCNHARSCHERRIRVPARAPPSSATLALLEPCPRARARQRASKAWWRCRCGDAAMRVCESSAVAASTGSCS